MIKSVTSSTHAFVFSISLLKKLSLRKIVRSIFDVRLDRRARRPKWFISLGLFSIICFGSKGQGYEPSRVIPPSPTAASLGVYGNYDVGLYTGRPNINIPLYDIKTSNHSLPINLQYDASGVRVSQQSSWVGLNWSLSAGGVITRTVRGLDDFGGNGYYIAPELPTTVTLENKTYFDQIAAGTMDSEADIFSYSVGPLNGKFVVGKSADGGKILVDQANNLKIEYLVSHWIITDSRGYKHYFGTQEIVTHDYNYSEPIELDNTAPLSFYNLSSRGAVTSSWYLDSIVSPSKEAIVFQYETNGKSISFIQKSEKESNLLYFSGFCSSASPRLPAGHKTYGASRQVILDLYLSKILFQNGSIEFRRTDRDDIDYIESEKPDKLSEVVIRDSDNKLVRAFSLHHSYFTDGARGRLKLDSLSEFDRYGNLKPPYKFLYFTNSLPNPYSKSIDHWGFYNAKGNSSLLPEIYVPVEGGDVKYFSGGDRSPDTTATNIKQGVLSSIQYPAGGSTQFDYELHEYGILPNDEDGFVLTSETRNAIANPDHQTSHAIDTFTLDEVTYVDFQFNYEMATEGATNFFAVETPYAYVLRADGSTVTAFSNYDCPGAEDPTCGSSAGTGSLVLPAGSYKIHVWYQAGWQTTMSATWKVKVAVTKKKGGGLRIKSITNVDRDRETSVRRFSYTTNAQSIGATTGRLITKPSYEYYFNADDAPLRGECPSYFGVYVARMSSSIFPMGLASSGTIVGYDIVTEIIGNNGEGGRIEHTFMNSEDQASNYPYIAAYCSPYNGKLKQSVTFNAQGIPLSKLEHEYKIKEEISLGGIKLFQEHFPELTTDYVIKNFDDYSSWVVQYRDKKTENMDAQTLVTETNYYHQNPSHKQITRVEHLTSDGKKLITKYKYPDDYVDAGSASFVSGMKDRNIISEVIEEQSLVVLADTIRLVSGTFTKYDLFNDLFYKPGIIYALTATEPQIDTTESSINSSNVLTLHPNYRQDVFFDSYSLVGNLQSFHKANDGNQIYVWDYNLSLAVAHIINATSTDIGYTSFESNSSGGLSYSGAVSEGPLLSSVPTGKRYYNLATGNPIAKTGLVDGNNYVISYWSDNGVYSIMGGDAVISTKSGAPEFGWTYYEHLINTTGTTLTISGNGSIDEVRIYPANARINTYCYDLLTGMTSSTDTNGITTYFEYDGFQRLKSVKDKHGNVLKRYHYHYKDASQGNE